MNYGVNYGDTCINPQIRPPFRRSEVDRIMARLPRLVLPDTNSGDTKFRGHYSNSGDKFRGHDTK